MAFELRAVSQREELDSLMDVVWKANYQPYRSLISGIFPIFGPMPGDREKGFQSAKDRTWNDHTSDPSSHWFFARETSTGRVVGCVQWQIHQRNPYPSGPPKIVADWWPEGESREFMSAMINQLYAARFWWMQRPHTGKSKDPAPHIMLGHIRCKHTGLPDLAANWMSVLPEYRGRGIGRLLMQYGIEKATELKIEGWLESSEMAKDLYESHGYRTLFKLQLDPSKKDPSEEWIRCSHNFCPTVFYLMWRPAGGVYIDGQTKMPWALGASDS